MRSDDDKFDLFQTFVNYCLVHFTTSINWRYNASSTCISDIFTDSDEALCILLLENNAEDYKKIYEEQRKINRKEARPLYTKVHAVNNKFQGWDKKGIKRFNAIVKKVNECRALNTSKEHELKLKMVYGKMIGCDETNNECNEEESDSDNDDEVEYAYDGFAGLSSITNVTEV